MESTALVSALQSVKDTVIASINSILPVGLAVFGAIWGIKLGVKFFKGIAK